MIASTIAMYNDPANEILGGWSFWTWKKVPTRWHTLLAITPPKGWQPLLDWLNKPSKDVPDRAQSISVLNEFVRAARLENTLLDQPMLDALRNTSASLVR